MNDEFEQNNDFEQGEDRLTELIKQAGETARRKKKKVLNKHFEKIRQAVKTAASRQKASSQSQFESLHFKPESR